MMEHSASIPPFIIAKAAAAAGLKGEKEGGRKNEDDNAYVAGSEGGISRGRPSFR